MADGPLQPTAPPRNGVSAIVVTFHPAPALLDNLALLLPQVESLVVVDNGSSPDTLSRLRTASLALPFTLIENGENLGIASALNVGVRHAREHGAAWAALFDQDSTVTGGFIEAMLADVTRAPDRDRIGLVACRYRDPATGIFLVPTLFAADGAPVEIMTSGSLLATRAIDSAGWFRDDFFIDQVDHEYVFRLRDLGWRVLQCDAAVLLHVAGNPAPFRLFGRTLFRTTHHRAERYYYMTRNGIVLARKYARTYPAWSRNTAVGLASLPLKILLAESQPATKLFNMLRGTIDALRGKMGKIVRL